MVRPKPNRLKYEDLKTYIEKGYIKIPQFQRDFVWKIEDTAKLLDSIIKGYPIGTFILWITRDRLASVKKLGGIELPEPHKGDNVQYVLDGQQRIASLYVVINGLTHPREGKDINYKKIYVDLEREISDEDPIITHIKPQNCITVFNLLKKDTIDFTDDYERDIVKKIGMYKKAFNDYEFSTIELRDYSLDSAVEIFTRINTTGKVLTLFEIVAAKTYDEDKKFDLQENYEKFQDKLRDRHYDTLRPRNILDCLALNITKDCTRKAILNLNKEEIIEKWDDTVKSIEYAVDYFRSFYNITISGILPYDSLIVPYSYFYFKNGFKNPNSKQDKYLQEYFWTAALTHRFSSATATRLRQDAEKIDLIYNNIRPEYDFKAFIDKDKIKNLNFSTADSFCKAIICLYAKSNPESFDNGGTVLIDNSWLQRSNSRNYHHFFPKKFLKSLKKSNENSIVNITLINEYLNKGKIRTRAPSEYLREFEKSNSNLKETMKSHLIDDMDEYGVWNDDYEIFLNKRAEKIYYEIMKFIDF